MRRVGSRAAVDHPRVLVVADWRRPSLHPTGRFRRTLLVALMLALAPACSDAGDDLAGRQAVVAARGAQVMPFDLDETTHAFTKTDDGGIQVVVADDPNDEEQIALIRAHLREERDKFSRGDFADPAAIHGHDMDGVAELEAGYADVHVEYQERADGAQLTYTSDRAQLVAALHSWFDRQVTDHGAHATAGGSSPGAS